MDNESRIVHDANGEKTVRSLRSATHIGHDNAPSAPTGAPTFGPTMWVTYGTDSSQSCVGLTFVAPQNNELNNKPVCTDNGCSADGSNPYVSLSHGGCSTDVTTWRGDGCDTRMCTTSAATPTQGPTAAPTAAPAAATDSSQSCVGLTFVAPQNNELNNKPVCTDNGCNNQNRYVSVSHGGCSAEPIWGADGCDTRTC
jgi:hypothetical protein